MLLTLLNKYDTNNWRRKTMNFLEFAEKILEEEKKALSPKEIWDVGVKKNYTCQLKTKGATPWNTIGAQIYCNIRDYAGTTKFDKIDGKSIFFLKSHKSGLNLANIADSSSALPAILERDLHKYVTYYVYTNFKIKTKTISAQKSLKQGRNSDKWRYPDIVGVYYPEWEPDIVNVSQHIGEVGIKLFSYELKRELDNTNLRETYFQAVSNSSWANEGYLAVLDITNDEEFYKEFKRLNNSFGIGLIKISTDDPEESKILFQSQQKENIDIETMNILSKNNVDFKNLMKDIKVDYGSTDRLRGKYDEYIPVEELYK
jgi:hypothetical protein